MTNELLTELRVALKSNGIDETSYSDEDLIGIISYCRNLLCDRALQGIAQEDYHPNFHGDKYITKSYPIDINSLVFKINNETIIPRKIRSNGIIYLDNVVSGELECTYDLGISEEEYNSVIIPLATYFLKDESAGNIESVHEGDISVSYANSAYADKITSLINDFKNKFKSRTALFK